MTCPRCGFTQPASADCARCGILIALYRPEVAPLRAPAPPTSPAPVPVAPPTGPYGPPPIPPAIPPPIGPFAAPSNDRPVAARAPKPASVAPLVVVAILVVAFVGLLQARRGLVETFRAGGAPRRKAFVPRPAVPRDARPVVSEIGRAHV